MVSREDRIYYEHEIRRLNREGQVFAERFPDIARRLGLHGSDAGLRDPHAERIVESFAFLTGKLHRFLDARFPELAHALFQMAYPAYLRPAPVKTLVQFSVMESMLDKPLLIPRGVELYADRLGPDGETYTFTTCWDVLAQPVEVARVYVDPEAPGDYSLSVALRLHPGVQAGACDWDRLEFTICGDPSVRNELFLQLAEHLEAATLKDLGGALQVAWSGFDREHDYETEGADRFSQLHQLRDYFDFPQRFYSFRIEGLNERLRDHQQLEELQINFKFRRPFAAGIHVQTEHLRLYCAVAQNLFAADCEPFTADEATLEYLLTPDAERVDLEVHSLRQVHASRARDVTPVRPYFHFARRHIDAERQWFYLERRELALDQGWDVYIRFLDMDHRGPGALAGQTLSVSAWCANRRFAQKLKLEQLNRISTDIPEVVRVRNIAQATRALWPELHSEREWDFLAHLALDYAELGDLDALRALLSLYNIGASESGERKIKGIRKVAMERDAIIRQGSCIQGQRMTLDIDGGHFSSLGDAALFARTMAAFLRAYCPINSFIRLEANDAETGTQFSHIAWG